MRDYDIMHKEAYVSDYVMLRSRVLGLWRALELHGVRGRHGPGTASAWSSIRPVYVARFV